MSWLCLRDHRPCHFFLVYTTEFDGAKARVTSTGAETKAGEETTVPKGWSFLNQGSGEVEEEDAGDNTSGTSQGKMITYFFARK